MPNSWMTLDVKRYWPLLALALLLVVTWLAYMPGLAGSFQFDDFVNLDALGNDGRVDNWATFWRYLTSGTADPGGRPISLLSFLLDARDWPADPAPFLRTNLMLHLFNGCLLFALLRQLGRLLDRTDPNIDLAALVGAGLWLLHPLFISTVFYVVQRQAMLPTTFTLLALIAYCRGRYRFVESGGVRGAGWMIAGVVLGTTLAMLSKLNGVLVPLLCLVLEWTILQRLDSPRSPEANRRLGRIQLVLLILPSALVLAYLAKHLGHLSDPLSTRSWTIGQRLITEPRVLLDYLQLLFVPRSVSSGLFNDGYIASKDLLQPLSTIFSCAFVIAVVIAAVRLRKKSPDISLALLFFFAGHLLESTIIPLELYFEHRNYLPALLLFWPVARALFRLPVRMLVRTGVCGLLLGILALTSYQRALIWGQPEVLARLWARQNLDSPRAQAAAAIADLGAGRVQAALERLAPLWNQNPFDLQIAFNFINARCAAKGVSPVEKAALARALRHTPTSELLIHDWLDRAIGVAASGDCPGLRMDDVDGWIQAALQNPVINAPNIRNQDMEPLLGHLALEQGQPRVALEHFNRALVAGPSPDVAARQASLLASYGAYREALAHLDVYEANKSRVRRPGLGMGWVHAKVIELQGYWPREMRILRHNLRAAIQQEGSTKQ